MKLVEMHLQVIQNKDGSTLRESIVELFSKSADEGYISFLNIFDAT